MKDATTTRAYLEVAASEQYICIDPKEAAVVFDCLENSNNQGKDLVQVHLNLCLHCKEIVAERLLLSKAEKVFNYLQPNKNDPEIEEEFDEQENSKEAEYGLDVVKTY